MATRDMTLSAPGDPTLPQHRRFATEISGSRSRERAGRRADAFATL